jgi:hypothetical protein
MDTQVPLAELQRKAEKALVLFREEEKRLGRGRSTKMTLKNLETPETQDLAIRELMEKYYCAPELTSLGRQGRAATAHLVDEVSLKYHISVAVACKYKKRAFMVLAFTCTSARSHLSGSTHHSCTCIMSCVFIETWATLLYW